MVKTKLEILEKMHDDTMETVLYTEAECDLIQGRIFMITKTDKEAEQRRAVYNEALSQSKTKLRGHETMLAKIAKMIEEETKKNVVQIDGK